MRVIVDGNMVAWANHGALGHLSYQGKQTGAFFGTLKQTRSFIELLKATELVVLWDVGRTWRNDLYEEYKGSRQGAADGFYAQIGSLRDAFYFLGVKQICSPGFEADDIAAYFAKHVNPGKNDTILISTDNDWLQLIRDGVSVFNPRTKNLHEKTGFKKATGYETPEMFVKSKVILGDVSDNIHGLEGVGPVKFKSYAEGVVDSTSEKIEKYLKSPEGRIAYELINLLDPKLTTEQLHIMVPDFSPNRFRELALVYGAKSLCAPDWCDPFEKIKSAIQEGENPL